MTLFWIFWMSFWAQMLKPPRPVPADPQPNGGRTNVLPFRRAA